MNDGKGNCLVVTQKKQNPYARQPGAGRGWRMDPPAPLPLVWDTRDAYPVPSPRDTSMMNAAAHSGNHSRKYPILASFSPLPSPVSLPTTPTRAPGRPPTPSHKRQVLIYLSQCLLLGDPGLRLGWGAEWASTVLATPHSCPFLWQPLSLSSCGLLG